MSGRSKHDTIVRAFFRDYARLFAQGLKGRTDAAALRACFADYFVGADPNGVRGARNGLLFRLMIPRGYKAYRAMGTRSMTITKLAVTTLDDVHAMAKVDWLATYDGRKGDGEDIAFANIYFLQVRDGTAKIFAYVTPDEQAALKAHGLVD